MFVRWKMRQSRGEDVRTLHSAVLVQSVRINGKPRQKIIAFLGSLREPIHVAQPYFWHNAETALNNAGIDGDTQMGILEKLATKTSRPTPKQMEAHRAMLARHKAMMRRE